MKSAAHPIVLYVPGLLPKPEPAVHRAALLRCLQAGLRRVDPPVADIIGATRGGFDMVSWTYDFYGEYRDYAIDADAVEAVIAQHAPTERDIAEAASWQRRVIRLLYLLGDRVPFLIPHLANERTEVHLRDLRRYVQDVNGIAAHTRRTVLPRPAQYVAVLLGMTAFPMLTLVGVRFSEPFFLMLNYSDAHLPWLRQDCGVPEHPFVSGQVPVPLSLIHISEPTRPRLVSRMTSSS